MESSLTSVAGNQEIGAPDRTAATVGGRVRVVAWWVAVAAVTAMLAWAYEPNVRELVQTWSRDPNYSHGYLVLPVALLILYRREAGAEWSAGVQRISRLVGWLMLAGSLGTRAFCYEHGLLWLETATLLPAVVGLVLSLGGLALLLRTWPAVAFLIFMLPLPGRLTADLALPLQKIATTLSCTLLRLSGLWVLAEGNTIIVDSSRLEVAQACNGLSMLMCMAATIAATTALVPMPLWKRAILLASFIPIALLSNVLRIVATAWCYHRFGAEVGGRFAHDAAGWLMMPTALLLVGLELACVSWLIVEEEEQAEAGFRPAWLDQAAGSGAAGNGAGVGGMAFPGRPGPITRKPAGPRREA